MVRYDENGGVNEDGLVGANARNLCDKSLEAQTMARLRDPVGPLSSGQGVCLSLLRHVSGVWILSHLTRML